MNDLEDSDLFLEDINNFLVDFKKNIQQENIEFESKKKKILNQSNILFTEIIINYCHDLKDKLETLSFEYKNNTQGNKSKHIIQYFIDFFIFSNDKDNSSHILKVLKDFYVLLSELNSLLLSKFNFTLGNIVSSIKDKYTVGDSVVFVTNNESVPCLIKRTPETLNGLYLVELMIGQQRQEISGDELLPDIIQFFINDQDKDEIQRNMIRYICRVLNGNEEGYEIKVYLLSILMPRNLFQIPFSSEDHTYKTINEPVVVWGDTYHFHQLQSKEINKHDSIGDLKEKYDFLYLNKSFLKPGSEIKIIYENYVDSFDFKLLFNFRNLKDNITRYIKIRDVLSSNVYWIQIQDIEFHVIENTFFYSYDNKLKRNLLNKKDSVTLTGQMVYKNENIIIPDYERNKVLFLTPVTLVSEYYIPSGTVVIDKSTNKEVTVIKIEHDPNTGEKIYKTQFKESARKRDFKREQLIWKDYPKVEGYISIEDTNCHLLQDDNLNGSLFRYLDSSTLENLFTLQEPIGNLSLEEKEYLDRINMKLGEKSHSLTSLYTRKLFQGIKKNISKNALLLVGYYKYPLSTLVMKGGLEAFKAYNDWVTNNNIDISYFHNLNVRQLFGQDLEKLLCQCIKYDYNFDKTPIILKSIIENPTNSDFAIFNKGYQILSFFLEFNRINQDNQLRVQLLFQSLLTKIMSSYQVSRFLVDLLNIKNIDSEDIEIAKEYIVGICNSHYLSVENLKFNSDYSETNPELKKYLFDFSISKVNKLKSMANFLNLDIEGEDITVERFYVLDDCTVYDKNDNSFIINKNKIVYKKRDSHPFIFTDKEDKYHPKKLFVSVLFEKKEINIPRNNIEYSFGN